MLWPIEPLELLPVLGVLGEVVLGEVLDEPVEPLVLPLDEPLPMPELVPPLELEDLLKCASHSEREIWPSLLVSTDEKLGVLALLELELGELDDVPPLAEGEDELLDLESPAATASVERAKSAAAVVIVTVLSI